MAKKQKRKSTQSAAPVASRTSSPRQANEFNPDYTYVIQDLKRIGILAASFTAILVVLSFILN